MIIDISLHLSMKDIRSAEIISRKTDIGERYWVIKLTSGVSLFIDYEELRELSGRISTALEDDGS